MSDLISRQGAIDFFLKKGMITSAIYVERMPSAQPEQHGRVFKGIVVEYPTYSTYPEYEGKPYFSIKYTENGQGFIGYGTFKPEVLSEYLKEYFIPFAQPEQRWIPCKERMPYIDGEYLITKKCFGWNCKKYYKPDIAWYGKKSGWHKADEVIAWCELPEPWKEGEA